MKFQTSASNVRQFARTISSMETNVIHKYISAISWRRTQIC